MSEAHEDAGLIKLYKIPQIFYWKQLSNVMKTFVLMASNYRVMLEIDIIEVEM
jgi:hypothetical protein